MLFMPASLRVAAERMPAEERREVEARWTIAGCPARTLARSQQARVILGLWNARRVSPLSGWPWSYVSWVTRGLTDLERAIKARGKPSE